MAVTTSLAAGTLTITGDAAADDIAIVGTANPGEITVTGRNGTMVDGAVNGSTTIPGVTDDLAGNFGDGDNVINIDNVYLAGHLDLTTGAGDDRVTLGATGVVSTRGHFLLEAGDGSDVFRAEPYKAFMAQFLWVFLEGGGETDTATLIGASAIESVSVNAGDSDATEIVVRGVTSGGNLEVRGRGLVNNIAVFTSAATTNILAWPTNGQNSIYIDTCYAGWIISAQSQEAANSTITVARCQTSQIEVRTASGDDNIDIYGNNVVGPPRIGVHVITVQTGHGTDSVTASYNVALEHVFFSLGQLNDTLTLAGNRVTGFASGDGGTGSNLLNLLGNQFGGSAFVQFQ